MKHFDFRRRLLSSPLSEELEPSGSFKEEDHPDHRPSFSQVERDLLKKDEDPVTMQSVTMTGMAMMSYTMDVASSAALCYWLFDIGRWWWYMNIGALLASLLVVNGFSIRWYIHDSTDDVKDHLPNVSPSHWVMRVLFHCVLLGPIIRYLELFLYGIHTCDEKDKNRHQYRLMFLQEDRDVSLLAMVGSFIKSAPLLVLNVYILLQHHVPIDLPTTQAQGVNLVSALVELSLSQSAYRRALRRSTPLKQNMSRLGTAVQFLSYCCLIGSRILCLAAFASEFRHWIFVFCGIHWTLMTAWLVCLGTTSCATASGRPRPVEELIFNVVIGVIYIFCFINVKDEPTRWKYFTYYVIVWMENIALSVLWYIKSYHHHLWFRIPLMTSIIVGLAVGLVLLICYYRFLHPNKKRRSSSVASS